MKHPSLKDPKAFSDKFLTHFLARGFGAMSKKETDLLVLRLLEDDGVLAYQSNHAVAQQLGFGETRLRSMRYELAQKLNEVDQKAYFESRLLLCLKRAQFVVVKDGGKPQVLFAIEDTFVRLSLAAKLKDGGGFSDSSFNSEIFRVDAERLCEALKSIYRHKNCAATLAKIEKQLNEIDAIKFGDLWREFVKGAANSLGEGIVTTAMALC